MKPSHNLLLVPLLLELSDVAAECLRGKYIIYINKKNKCLKIIIYKETHIGIFPVYPRTALIFTDFMCTIGNLFTSGAFIINREKTLDSSELSNIRFNCAELFLRQIEFETIRNLFKLFDVPSGCSMLTFD